MDAQKLTQPKAAARPSPRAPRGECLEKAVLSRLEPPEAVREFNHFEELSKLYEIEQPLVPRTRVELQFDVYDGRRLQRGLYGSLDEEESHDGLEGVATGGSESSSAAAQAARLVAKSATTGQQANEAAGKRQSVVSERNVTQQTRESWCKWIFARRQNRRPSQRRQPPESVASGSPFKCCLKPSDTNQELGLVSRSASGLSATAPADVSPVPALATNSLVASVQASLQPRSDGGPDAEAIKREAFEVVSSALKVTSTSGRLPIDALVSQALAAEANPGSAFALESAQMELSGGCVSVCLLDRCLLNRPADCPSVNGRRWARASAKLVQLRAKLRRSAAPDKTRRSKPAGPKAAAKFARQLDQIARKASHKLWSELARDTLVATHASGPDIVGASGRGGRVSAKPAAGGKARTSANKKKAACKVDAEQLIALVKGSLNQLIDAQLLLRNKLAGADQAQNCPLVSQLRGAEFEGLLRNNFNLLKIWQNLEETRGGLACFVCEPIRASLADLFWFNRQRVEWAPAAAFESVCLNSNTTPFGSDSLGSRPLLVSPLVCLDANQVKRGLLQVLEALSFLHGVCKLIHRNVNPRNVLVCQLDNWKLSGLEFAVRFESTTISESASMLAREFSALRYGAPPNGLQRLGAGSGAGCFQAGASSSAPLRRQRTLHQTKCEEYVARPHTSLPLQPELDYLAPEVVQSALCSHKSDLFSFALVAGQTYDLCAHRPPISCRTRAESYEVELKKLAERRPAIVQRSPFEMRPILFEMLESEPGLRPSAGHALQLLKRPVELCRSGEHSLRHLKTSIGFLDNRQQQPAADQQAATRHRPLCYFKRVTSAAANQQPPGRQTESLQLLNCLVRALDGASSSTSPPPTRAEPASSYASPAGGAELLLDGQRNQRASPLQSRRPSFGSLRLQLEQTLEALRLALKSAGGFTASPLASGRVCTSDSRATLLLVALHRRLLEQAIQLRAELPPLCRLIAPPASAAGQPLDRSRAGASHRAFADLEGRLCATFSAHSVGRLGEALADPLLKLDEFLLVYELINDLIAFVGQRWRHNFGQRGRQLLNELTPVTGCPSLSSSEEDDDEEVGDEADCGDHAATDEDFRDDLGPTNRLQRCERAQVGGRAFGGSALALAMQGGNSPAGAGRSAGQPKRLSQQSYRGDQTPERARQQQAYNLPTLINVTAPSPMGSVRDVCRAAQQASDLPQDTRLFSTVGNATGSISRHGSQMKRHSHQDVLAYDQLADKTNQISLDPSPSRRSIASQVPLQQQQQQWQDAAAIVDAQSEESGAPQHDDESRSRLIDELLKTINDDSFNEFIDFNNKLSAATNSDERPQADQLTSSSGCEPANRPRSALGSVGGVGHENSARCSSATAALGGQRQQQAGSPRPPQTLNLVTGLAGAQQSPGRRMTRGSICAPPTASGQQQGSTFDNVIRRMSTNFVQNFNKMSAGTLGASAADSTTAATSSSSISTSLRREKSSNTTYANTLYVDNQVPARRHSDNTINVPRIQVALSSPSSGCSRTNLNQRASLSASKLATKWKLTAKTNQREASDKLSPNLGGALGYIRRHSSGNTPGGGGNERTGSANANQEQGQSNGLGAQLLNASPFKTRSSSNLGIDFLMSNRSMKRRYSAASMLGHQTQRKAEDLIDAGMKSVQNMFG